MVINHDKKFIFIAIPKTGSKSISAALDQWAHPEPSEYHKTLREAILQYDIDYQYKAFAFVRNPLDRLVSMWNDFKLNRVDQYSEHVKMDKPLLHEFKDFNDFCINLKNSHWKDDIFFKPQCRFLEVEYCSPTIMIGYFETLEEDLKTICKWLGIEYKNPPKLNIGLGNRNYRDYYSPEAKEAIVEFYKEDFRKFGYNEN